MRSRQDSAVIFLAFYFQLIQYAAHLFVSSDAGRNQRQAQTVLNHSHHAEHGFHSGRVTVDKQQLEQLRKLVMDGQRIVVVADQCQTRHAAELTRKGISDNGDNAHGSQGNQREGNTVVARDYVEILRFVLDDIVHLCNVARCFLDSHDVLEVACQTQVLPDASLIATMFLKSRARRKVVSAVMFTPVRPGTL